MPDCAALISGLRCALQIPHVNRQEFTLLDITEDGFVSQPIPALTALSASRQLVQPLMRWLPRAHS